jgi:hypothetical protein
MPSVLLREAASLERLQQAPRGPGPDPIGFTQLLGGDRTWVRAQKGVCKSSQRQRTKPQAARSFEGARIGLAKTHSFHLRGLPGAEYLAVGIDNVSVSSLPRSRQSRPGMIFSAMHGGTNTESDRDRNRKPSLLKDRGMASNKPIDRVLDRTPRHVHDKRVGVPGSQRSPETLGVTEKRLLDPQLKLGYGQCRPPRGGLGALPGNLDDRDGCLGGSRFGKPGRQACMNKRFSYRRSCVFNPPHWDPVTDQALGD